MKISEAPSVSPEYIRSELTIAQSHADANVRARARNSLLAMVMPKLLEICRWMHRRNGPSVDEMMSEAVMSAIASINAANTDMADGFVAYVCTRARFSIRNLLVQSSERRPLPMHVVRRLRAIAAAADSQNGAEQGGARVQKLKLGSCAVRNLGPLIARGPESAEATIVMCDNLPDAEASSPADLCERSDRTVHIGGLIAQALTKLTQRQREVLTMTYLRTDAAESTQLKVAAELGISPQRVQRILKAGLHHMRDSIQKEKYAPEDSVSMF